VALARPQFGYSTESQRTLGVDIVIAVDMSDSMTAEDFHPNRLAAARAAMREFVSERPSDNIGIVGFGSYAAMLCPMTPDVRTVMQFIDLIDFRQLGRETALGDALMLSVKKLEASEAKSKVVVLMTDGQNTAGETEPLKAAEIAAALGITVHTVGIGSDGTDLGRGGGFSALFGTRLSFDPEMLTRIAQMTGGTYHNATDEQRFAQVFEDIDALEKSRIEMETSRDFAEQFQLLVWGAVVLLALELLLGATWLRRLP
jgi:Ca-activated chloride channel family protein